MRLFTGIDLSSEVLANLRVLAGKLQPAARINWSPITNLHITTKFIGEWPETRLLALKEALARVPLPPPFHIAIRGLGWFPNQSEPRVFWAGVDAPAPLRDLARETEAALEPLGVTREERRYSPHLTLARIKSRPNIERLLRAIDALPSADFGAFTVQSFNLYLSERGSSGSVYTKLATFPPNGGAS
jgi:2'-5' RNA ligase